ncbi:hypothetical protein EV122DRAFT_227326 [Schizophyllum commune]
MLAIKIAAEAAPYNRELRIESDSKWAIGELTDLRDKHEDEGHIDSTNAALIKATIASLRERRAFTLFKWVKGHAGHEGNEKADQLAGRAARRRERNEVQIEVAHDYRVSGAKLMTMTQARAYKAIIKRKAKKVEQRRRTKQNLTQVVDDLTDAFGYAPTDEKIWKAIRHKDLQLECRYFLWMLTHDAYRVGDQWMHEKAPEDIRRRAYCQVCDGAVETMHHILFDCESTERALIWGLTRSLWELTGEEWREPSLGIVVGAACGSFYTDEGDPKFGRDRLWTILIGDSAHLIWKLRCERVIKREGAPFSEAEVKRRWRATLEQRLDMDRRLTSTRRYGGQALSGYLVEATWTPVLRDRESLPTKWATDIGVLVGIQDGFCESHTFSA